ncbi:MAG: PDZ domain-containing protein, partial [Planctomycetota bacterium]
QLGFQNFSMPDFGVQKAALKKIARTPKLPGNEPSQRPAAARPKLALEHFWRGAIVRNLVGDEFSAFGVPKEAGGVHLKTVPQDSPAAADGLQSNDLIQSLNQQPVKNVADLWRLQNAAAGQPLQIQFVRDQKTNQLVIKRYLFMKTESAEAHAFSAIRLEKSQDVLPFAALTTQPATNNESATTLFDGQLARNYGPVFGNGVEGGLYKVDLGRRREIRTIQTWSFQQNGVRGPQHFTLYGSPSETDPGWNTRDRKLFRAVLEVDATSSPADPFQATRIQSSDDESIGSYRWLLWQVHSVTSLGENTAFQEFQVVGLPEK